MKSRRITKALVISMAGLGFTLAACAHDNSPPPVALPPKAPPPILCQPIPDEPRPQGAVVRPITEREIQEFDRLVDYELDLRLHSREGWGRARIAKETFCPP